MSGLAAALLRRISGRVVAPGQPGWDDVRRPWNLRFDQRPAAVVEVADVADVCHAVRVAGDFGVPVAAQPRGHGATAALDGTILLRTGAMRAVELDGTRRRARVGAGVRWQRLNEALTGSGLTSLPGSSSDPSVVGYTIGGGLSWFGRRYGLAAHRLRAAEVVTAGGAHTWVTRDSDPELFWALRGGGGEFGIVTTLELELLPAPHIYGGRLLWPATQARAVLNAFAATVADAPEELTLWAWLLNVPDAPPAPPPLRGRWAVAVGVTYLGDAAAGDRLMRPLVGAAGPPLVDTRGTVSLAGLGGIAAEPVEPTPVMEGAAMLNGFDESAVDALLDATAPGPPSPLAVVALRHLGGALSRPSGESGAVGPVPEPFLMVLGGPVPSPDVAPELGAAIGRVTGAVADRASGRTPPNFGPDAAACYPADVLSELRRIKRERDPRGLIRGNRPLLPEQHR
jgi:FAD/FMN-containing dehydrogenase